MSVSFLQLLILLLEKFDAMQTTESSEKKNLGFVAKVFFCKKTLLQFVEFHKWNVESEYYQTIVRSSVLKNYWYVNKI